jgi:hypothetical protein
MDKPPGLLAAVLETLRTIIYNINAAPLLATQAFNTPILDLLTIIVQRLSKGHAQMDAAKESIINFTYQLCYEIYKAPELCDIFIQSDTKTGELRFAPFDIFLVYLEDELAAENRYIRMGIRLCLFVENPRLIDHILRKTDTILIIATKLAFYFQ